MKVYLSKSNASDPDVVAYVRKRLTQLGVTIVEFHGGPYDKRSVLEAEYLVIVPPARTLGNKEKYGDEWIWNYGSSQAGSYDVGRGQHDQIEMFRDHRSSDKILLVEEVKIAGSGQSTTVDLYVDEYSDIDVEDINWEERYSYVSMEGNTQLIEDALDIDPDTVVQNSADIPSGDGRMMLAAAKMLNIKL